jgi:phage shock protein A
VEDILERLGNVETDVSDLKTKVGTIVATVPHLATKADVMDVRSAVAELRAEMSSAMGSLRAGMERALGSMRADMERALGSMRADMERALGSIRADMAARENAFMKWMIATVLAAGGLALAIAKFVH